jgi:hypothetical protein
VTHYHSQYLRPDELSASLGRDVDNLRTGSRSIATSLSGTGLAKQAAGGHHTARATHIYIQIITVVNRTIPLS